MSLALTQTPRRLGGLGGPPPPPPAPSVPGADFLLDTLAGVEGGPVAMGAEEEASSVEAVASPPPPVAPAPALIKSSHRSGSHHHGYANCFGLPYQDHNYGAPPPATPPQSPPPPPPPRSPVVASGGGSALGGGGTPRLNGTLGSPPSLLEVAVGSPPLTNGGGPLPSPPEATAHHRKGPSPPEPAAHHDEGALPAEESITRCICGFNQDDEYMICCDRCLVWQHVDCMGLDRSRIPETYLCERCCPRRVDRQRARSLQTRKRHQMARLLSRLESAQEVDGGSATDDKASTTPHSRTKGGTAEPTDGSPPKRGASSRVVRRKRRRSESSPDGPPPSRKLQTNPKRSMKEKIERKKVKLKGMVKRGPPSRGGGGGRRLTTELADEVEESAVGDPWRGGGPTWVGPEGPLSYERAPTNQYSPEVQLLASTMPPQGSHEELLQEVLRPGWEGAWRLEECPKGGGRGGRRLVATRAVAAHQPLLEVRGKFLSAGQFRLQNPVFQKRLYPFVFFYKGLCCGDGDASKDEEGSWVCVDARAYGNEARFVRRSCRPTARVQHTLQGGMLRLYLVASRDIVPGQELTIPFDFDYRHCIHRVTCVCGQDDCRLNRKGRKAGGTPSNTPPERKRRGRRMSSSSGSHGAEAPSEPVVVAAKVEVKEEPPPPAEEVEEEVTSSGPSLDNTKDSQPLAVVCGVADATTSSNEQQDGSPQLDDPGGQEGTQGNGGDDPDGDPPEPTVSSRRRKMTREERKIDAIMRAFEKMERTEKRRQQALERMAQHGSSSQHGGRGSLSSGPLKTEGGPHEVGPRVELDERSNDGPLDTPMAATISAPPEAAELGAPEEEHYRSLQQHRAASRKGKRRRSTLSRRRTRSNSGGPELLLAAAATVEAVVGCPEGISFPPSSPPCPSYEALPSPPPLGALSPDSPCQQEAAAAACQRGYALPKSKRFLMQGWLHEKAEQQEGGTAAPSSSLGGECPVYVRCTPRDGGGISAAHLRRHSCSSAVPNTGGSAKKRWLRQAMFESSEEAPDEGLLESSELPASPMLVGTEDSCHSISPPPGADLVTPLKKRRLMRESRGSLDSAGALSPATGEAAATLLSFQTPLLLLASQAQQLAPLGQEEGPPTTTTAEEEEQAQPQAVQQEFQPVDVAPEPPPVADETSNVSGVGGGSPSLMDDPPTPLDDEESVDWEDGPPASPPAALGPRLLPPLTSGQPSPLELAGRLALALEGRPPCTVPRLPEPLPGPQPDEDEPAAEEQREAVEPNQIHREPAAAFPKPVSLSEYRQRMRETARAATAVPAPLAVAMPTPLVLQESSSPVKADPGLPASRGSAAIVPDEDESWPQRERLSQRLRREFGLLDDDSDTERGGTCAPPLPPPPNAESGALPPMMPPHVAGLPYPPPPHGYLPVPPLQVPPFGTPLTALRPPLLPATHLGGGAPVLPPSSPHLQPPGYFHHS
ncbi:uncharacterized protein LOC144106674 isoform X2 [Amblyomma americanum]